MKHISAISSQIISKNLTSHDLAVADLFLRWDEIVGENLSSFISPSKTSKSNGQSTLYLSVSKYDSLKALYSQNLLLDKINSFFGKKYFTNIKIISSSLK